VISIDELHKVTPDAPGKSRFVFVDCVGVTETDKTETKSLETKPSVSTAKLMEQVARGDRHSDTLRALGNRMIRLDLKLNAQQRKRITELAGKPLALIAGELIHATNEERLIEAAQTHARTDAPTEKQIQAAFKVSADNLIKPFHNPDLRELIDQLRRDTDQLIDDSADHLLSAGYDGGLEQTQKEMVWLLNIFNNVDASSEYQLLVKTMKTDLEQRGYGDL
jgi:type I restriction enzyme R subunit